MPGSNLKEASREILLTRQAQQEYANYRCEGRNSSPGAALAPEMPETLEMSEATHAGVGFPIRSEPDQKG
jgi:hypothetical protein